MFIMTGSNNIISLKSSVKLMVNEFSTFLLLPVVFRDIHKTHSIIPLMLPVANQISSEMGRPCIQACRLISLINKILVLTHCGNDLMLNLILLLQECW